MAALAVAALSACGVAPPADEVARGAAPGSTFSHGLGEGPKPWNHERFDTAPGKFTFAVFSDLTGGEREGVFSVAVEQLRLLRPELILNVGDLTEGERMEREVLEAEWDSFEARAARARAPVFHVGGNHDLSSPLQWDVWAERHGPKYYHFRYRDVLFLVLDTEDNPREEQQRIDDLRAAAMEVVEREGWGAFGETDYYASPHRKLGRVGPEQAAYFREVIAANPDVRWTFVFMHKPAWERENEEHFAAIEAALADRPYTVFHGHVHAYEYQQRHGRDYIRLATTGGVQIEGRANAFDHVTLVTVADDGVDIANLRLDGILDKTGRIPAGGEALCFEAARCGPE